MKYWSKLVAVGLLIGFVLAGIQIVMELLAGTELYLDRRLIKEIGYNLLFAIALTLLNGAFFDYLNYRVVWKNYGRYRLAIGAVGGVVLTMMGIFGMRVLIFTVFEGQDWNEFIEGETAIYYAISLLITMVISVFFHAIYFYKALQEKKVKEQKVIAGTASAKFDALKNQLDPHFLFNSLNVLTSLIEEDPDQAQKFTTSLSKIYRYVLEQKNKDLVSVEEELQFAKTYVRLLKMRFEDSIVFDIPDTAKDPQAKIVPLSLQLLLENAVKHNVVTASRPLHIRVYEKENKLIVSNNLQEKQVVRKSSGVGLLNIQQRYGILTDREVAIQKSVSDFSVSLPMLTRQVSVMNTQKSYIEDKRYKKAKEKVEAVKGFYGNLISYCIVLPFLAYLNYRTSDFPWVVFPLVFWGLGVVGHGMEAFGYNPIWGKRWEEKKMRKFMEDENF